MKIHLLLVFLFSVVAAQTECPQAPDSPQDRRSNKDQLTIATYNGEWLFIDRYNCPGTGCPWTTNETVNFNRDYCNKIGDRTYKNNSTSDERYECRYYQRSRSSKLCSIEASH